MSRTKRQHYVPRLHLRHFVGDEPPGMVWTYDVLKESWRPSTPENTAVESNFYSLQDENGKHNDALEDWLGDVENKAASIYQRLINGEIPVGQERADFATFLASLYARSPGMLRIYGEMLGKSAQPGMQVLASSPEHFDAFLTRFERDKGPVKPDVRARLREFILDTTRYTMEVDRRAALRGVALSDKLQTFFFKMGWAVVDTGSHVLITGDCPVVRVTPPATYHPIYGDGGFINKQVLVTLPLTPFRCLVMSWQKDFTSLLTATREDARTYNRQRAHFAERYLYTMKRDSGVAALGEKYRGKRLQMTMDSPHPLASVEVKRKLQWP